ncbi:TB2/DP1, HVA22 family-domain-containing protein [Xylaria nigripes]|nr:TB2/DP1, HVA22 family-domain-containing protein [Xylaria nigripes]
MFSIIANFFSSIASFLFPLYASYKALKTSDPSQLTPWLMYWSVLSCALLAETWTEFILVWIPFYSWMRLGFLLWLVLPSTQGARVLYESYLHPYLEENELAIEEFIARAHDRIKAEGFRYLQQVIELIRTQVFNLPPSGPPQEQTRAAAAPQGYMQALLARFSMPALQQTPTGTRAHGSGGSPKFFYPTTFADFERMMASALNGTTGGSTGKTGNSPISSTRHMGATIDGSPMPEEVDEAPVGFSYLAEQRERLAAMLGALDNKAAELQKIEESKGAERLKKIGNLFEQQQDPPRPPSEYSVGSALSKSRSEVDFENIDAPSGAEEDAILHRRGREEGDAGATRGGWNLFGWGATDDQAQGQSTGYRRE